MTNTIPHDPSAQVRACNPSIIRAGYCAVTADIGFLAAVDATAIRSGLATGLLALREQTVRCMSIMAEQLRAAAQPTAASARAVRAHAHAAGLPVFGGTR